MFKLRQGEKIEQEIRRHWFVMVPHVFGFLVALVVPVVVLVVAVWLSRSVGDRPLEVSGDLLWLVILLYLFWVLISVIYLFVAWTTYYLDVWYLTNQRLIDVDQKWLFSRNTKSLRYERIQDVTVEVHGFLATMLKFGEVHVQTAGATRRVDIEQVRKPYELRRLILDYHDQAAKEFYKVNQKDFVPSGVAGQTEESQGESADVGQSDNDGL